MPALASDVTTTGNINPFMATFSAPEVAAYHKWEAKSLDECVKAHDDRLKTLREAAEQVSTDDGTNFDGLTLWSGDAQEKSDKIIDIHSQLTGIKRAIEEKRRDAQLKELEAQKIVQDNHQALSYTDNPIGDLARQLRRKELPSEAIAAACQEQFGASLGEVLSDIKTRGVVSLDRTYDRLMPAKEFFGAVFTTSDWDPFVTREPGWTPSRQTPLQVSDIITPFMTEKDAVQWMEETTYSNAAAETQEGGQVPESTFELTVRNNPVVRIGHYVPVTEEALGDEPQVRSYLDYVMPTGVRQRMDAQIINGTGASGGTPQLQGILSYGAKTATSAAEHTGTVALRRYTRTAGKIAKPWNLLLDANYDVRDHGMGILGMQMPTHYILHPNIYLECLQAESSSGGYYVGGPSSPLLGTAWGIPVVETTHLETTASTTGVTTRRIGGIVGDFSPMFIRNYMRHEYRTEFGHIADDFRRFQMSIRSSVRCVLAIMRAGAYVVLVNPASDGSAHADS